MTDEISRYTPETPEKQISYSLDITKPYHNMLMCEEAGNKKLFFWDYDVVSMEEGMGDFQSGIDSHHINFKTPNFVIEM